MLETYSKIDSDKNEKIFKKLSDKEKQDIADYLKYRQTRGLNAPSKLTDTRSTIIHLRATAQKNLAELDIKEITKLAALIKESEYSQYSKNEILINLKRYIKWKSPTINLEDIRLIQQPSSKKIINQSDLLSKEDVEKLIRHEPKMFWKAFLILQYEGGLRTKEVRMLKSENIKFNVDGDLSEITIHSTKTNKTRTIFVKESTFYLKKLREEQENLEQLGMYIFHSPRDLNAPIDRGNISMWMRRLSQKALGKQKWNYLLRHSRGNELYQLSKQGKISKDIALAFMGHSEKMSKVYTHDKSKEIKEMLKNQVYHLEDAPEKVRKFEHELLEILITTKDNTKDRAEKLVKLYEKLSGKKAKIVYRR